MLVPLITRVILIAINFLTTVVAAKLYGPIASGQMGMLVALLGISSIFALGGTEIMALKRLSGKSDDRNDMFTIGLFRLFIGVFFAIFILLFFRYLGFGNGLAVAFGSLLVLLLPILIAVSTLRIFLMETIRASGSIVKYSLMQIFGPILILGLLLAYRIILDGQSFSWLVAIAEVSGMVLTIFIFFREPTGLKIVKISWKKFCKLEREVRKFWVSSLSVAIYQLDILIVGFMVSPEDLGVYVVSSRISAIVGLPMIASSINFAPKVAQVYRNSTPEDVVQYAYEQTLLVVKLCVPIGVMLILIGESILSFLGEGFEAGYTTFFIMCCAKIILSLGGQSGILLMMTGHEPVQQKAFFTATLVMFLTIFFLVPKIGILGAALAVLLGAVIRVVICSYYIVIVFGRGITIFRSLCNKQ